MTMSGFFMDLDLCPLHSFYKLGYTDLAMKKIKKLFLMLTYFFMIFVLLMKEQSFALLQPDQLYVEGRLDVQTSVDYFRTTTNFNSNGTTSSLPANNYLQVINLASQVRWAAFETLGFRFGGNMGFIESSDLLATRANSAINRLDFGIDYLSLKMHSWEAILDFEYSHSLEPVDVNTDSALTNSGAHEMKPQIILRYQAPTYFLFGQTGINYRTDGLSTLWNYGTGAEYLFDTFSLGAQLQGYMSVTDDSKINQTSYRDFVTSRVNAGSKYYYSVNPGLIHTDVYVNLPFTEKLHMQLKAGYDLAGNNTAQGILLAALLRFSFDDVGSLSSHFGGSGGGGNQQDRPLPVVPEERFKVETNDGVNQKYFTPKDPIKENYNKPTDQILPVPKPVKKKKKKNVTLDSSLQKGGMKSPLSQPGYSIKLKRTGTKSK